MISMSHIVIYDIKNDFYLKTDIIVSEENCEALIPFDNTLIAL